MPVPYFPETTTESPDSTPRALTCLVSHRPPGTATRWHSITASPVLGRLAGRLSGERQWQMSRGDSARQTPPPRAGRPRRPAATLAGRLGAVGVRRDRAGCLGEL